MRHALVTLILCTPLPSYARKVDVASVRALVEACTAAELGDEIVIARGTYTISGMSRIHIQNRKGPVRVCGATKNPADVVIEGAGQDREEVQVVFELTDSPQWTFENLTTRNTYYHGFKFNGESSRCVLRNIVMRDHGESGVKGTSDPKGLGHPDELLAEGCDIGFSRPEGGTRKVVEGIDGVAVNRWNVRDCRFLNIQKGGGVAYGVFTKGNSSDTTIERNRFENCFIGASFGGGGTDAAYFRDGDRQFEHRGGEIRGNVFSGCSDAAIYINRGNGCMIEGNTLIDCMMNIQIRYPESTGRISGNNVHGREGEPIIRIRDRATVLLDENNRRFSLPPPAN